MSSSVHLGDESYDSASCQKCGRPVPFHVRHCPYCQGDVGFPNVRKAESKQESDALNERYAKVKASLKDGEHKIFQDFETVVFEKSKAVICKPFHKVLDWLTEGTIFTNFHNELASNQRIGSSNGYDQIRNSVDALLFPEYLNEISFASLSLDGCGDRYYGGISVQIQTDAIESRVTAFHENSIEFVRSKGIGAGSQLPLGFRSSWDNRAKLAAIKHVEVLKGYPHEDEFASILLKSSQPETKVDGDYIELHIYGGLMAEAMESIRMTPQTNPAEALLMKTAVRKANQRGLPIELDAGS
jgi:hypothetical protein